MTSSQFCSAACLVLLAAAWGALALPHPTKAFPPVTPLATIPRTLGGWTASAPSPPAQFVQTDPKADERLYRTYDGQEFSLWVAVDYYSTQSEGHRPSIPDLLYPDEGWTEFSSRSLEVPLERPSMRSILVNLLATGRAGRRVAVLYWYQVGERTIASDHWYRGFALYDRVIHRRSSAAVVRITSVVPDAVQVAEAVDTQVAFVRLFYPELLRVVAQSTQSGL